MANNLQAFSNNGVLTLEPIELDPNDKGESPKEIEYRSKPFYTANLEIAPIINGRSSHQSKIIFRLGLKELALVTCVFLGLIPAFTLKREDKWMTLVRQKTTGVLFIKSYHAKMLAMPVSAADVFLFTDLLLSRVLQSSDVPAELLIVNLRSTAALYYEESTKVATRNAAESK